MIVKAFKAWAKKNRELCVDLLRIYLGVLFVWKGFHFGLNRQELVDYLKEVDLSGLAYFDASELLMVHYAILVHISGGVMLLLGLMTRIAALIQIPAVVGAAVLVHAGQPILGQALGLEYVTLLLFVLLLFVVYGSGPLSIDALLEKKGSR